MPHAASAPRLPNASRRDGAAVAITYSCFAAKADEVVRDIEAAGGKAIAIRADAADEAAVRAAIQQTLQKIRRPRHPREQRRHTGDRADRPVQNRRFRQTLAVNVRGVFVAMQEASLHLRDGGRIINIGSTNSERMPFVGGSVTR